MCAVLQSDIFTANVVGVEAIVRNDALIQDFAVELLGRLGTASERRSTDFNNIKTKVRSVARLCHQIRMATDTSCEMMEYISPTYFRATIAATKELALVSPQLAIALGHYLRSLVLLKISHAIASEDETSRKQADDFKYLMEAHWKSQVTTVTRRRQRLLKLNKEDQIPETSDLIEFSQFLKKRATLDLSDMDLAKCCLTQLILFNKRRPMEVAELTKENYRQLGNRNETDNEEVLASLTKSERTLAKR